MFILHRVFDQITGKRAIWVFLEAVSAVITECPFCLLLDVSVVSVSGWCRYRDMRRETSHEIKSMWYNLGRFHA